MIVSEPPFAEQRAVSSDDDERDDAEGEEKAAQENKNVGPQTSAKVAEHEARRCESAHSVEF